MDDAISVIRQAMTSMLNDNDDVIRSSFRRGQLYNKVNVGLECRHETESSLSHWIHGPIIATYLKQAITSDSRTYHCYISQTGDHIGFTDLSLLHISDR